MPTNETTQNHAKIKLLGDEKSKKLLISCKLILEMLRGASLCVEVKLFPVMDLSVEMLTGTTEKCFPIPTNIQEPTQLAFYIRKLIASDTQQDGKQNSLKNDQIKKFGRADMLV